MAYPTLNANSVFGSLYNQVISIQQYAPSIVYDGDIVQSRKVDGTLYGDTKVYRWTDVLQSYGWDHTDAQYNLLTHKRPPLPGKDTVTIDTFRQIPVTIDEYLSKQAWTNEGSFAEFNSTILSWMGVTRSVYEHTNFTAAIVQTAVAGATSIGTISLKVADIGTAAEATPAEINLTVKHRYEIFARKLRALLKELNEASRDYNALSFLMNVNPADYDIILPVGINDALKQYGVSLPLDIKEVHWKYFGTLVATGGTTADATKRAAVEKTFKKALDADPIHLFPGDIVPNAYVYLANEIYTPTYTAAPDLLASDLTFVIIHKQDFPIPSAFSVQTSFFNPKDLVVNHYLTWGYSEPRNNHLSGLPLLKVSTDVA